MSGGADGDESGGLRVGEALKAVWLPALGLLLGAMVVGLVYNSVSPLGVAAGTRAVPAPVVRPPAVTPPVAGPALNGGEGR